MPGAKQSGVPVSRISLGHKGTKGRKSGILSSRKTSVRAEGFDPILDGRIKYQSTGDESLGETGESMIEDKGAGGRRLNSFESTSEVLPVQEIILNDQKYDVRATGLVGPVYFGPHKGVRQLPAQYRDEFFARATPAFPISADVRPKNDLISVRFEESVATPMFDRSDTFHIGRSDMGGNQLNEWIAVNPRTGLPQSLLKFSTEQLDKDVTPVLQTASSEPWFPCWALCCSHGDKEPKNSSVLTNGMANGRHPSDGKQKEYINNFYYATHGPLVVSGHPPLPKRKYM